jgi:multiple sugar transport system permease protein
MAQAVQVPAQPVETAGSVQQPGSGPVLQAPLAGAPLGRTAAVEAVHHRRSAAARLFIHGVLFLGSLVMLFPFYWMIVTSFKTNVEAAAFPPAFIPRVWHPENYVIAWAAAPFSRYFFNTAVVAVCWVAGVVVVSSLAAYAFARMQFYGKNAVFMLFLATLMIPGDVTLIPNFVVITKWLGWYNTYQAQFITAIGNVFAIFLLRQFFMSVPKELEEAALIDGASRFRFMWQILLPLSRPALVTVALLNFLSAWDSFLWPLLVTSQPEMRPIQVGLKVFQSDANTRYAELMAASAFVMAPTAALFLMAQRYFVEGIARSGLKG